MNCTNGSFAPAGRTLIEQPPRGCRPTYYRSLAEAVREPDELISLLGLPDSLQEGAARAARLFPLLVPRSYVSRMRPGDPTDPLLRQVLPLDVETQHVEGFTDDAVGDLDARKAPGLIHKYDRRALLISTGTCAIHCRYCFRRHYPYEQDPRRLDDWEPAFAALAVDESIDEVILSGGDPLMLTDARLAAVVERLEAIPHLRRLRIHTRLPIVLPDRVTTELIGLLGATRLQPVMVVHANHANELVADCAAALVELGSACGRGRKLAMLNQAVLLSGVNDDVESLTRLSERLFELGILPYYLHQLDRVAGAAHFEVPESTGRRLMSELHRQLPGYLVPKYVREVPGEPGKTAIG